MGTSIPEERATHGVLVSAENRRDLKFKACAQAHTLRDGKKGNPEVIFRWILIYSTRLIYFKEPCHDYPVLFETT
jgi:hypothetical protein